MHVPEDRTAGDHVIDNKAPKRSEGRLTFEVMKELMSVGRRNSGFLRWRIS